MKDSKQPKQDSTSRIKKVRKIVPQVAQRFRKPSLQEQTEEALQNVPRITNETVAEHREEVLKGARKFKYPLEHSKHRIVIVSAGILSVAFIGFFVYVGLSLYRYQSTSLFTYRVTQILPLPVAKAGGRWVSYESYLFDLRRHMHYYEAQQQVDYASKDGKLQLAMYKPKALQTVIDDAYVKELASKHGIKVSERDVDDEISMLRSQNQLGSSNEELASVVKKTWGWSLSDLRRVLSQKLLAQKVAAKLDTATHDRAQSVLVQLQGGTDFATLATQVSDDGNTKANGGQYNDTAITMSSKEVPPMVVRALSAMEPGQVSGIIITPTAYEVVKLLSVDNGKYKAAHIQIRFQDIQTYLQPLERQHPAIRLIHVVAPI